MPTAGIVLPDPQLRLSRGQRVLAALLVLLIIGLIAENSVITSRYRGYSEVFARTETAAANTFYTMGESLTYTNEVQRYLLGSATRRDVQLKRALLARRLAVVGQSGKTAGDSTTPEFSAALSALDDAIRQMPPGTLPADQREQWAAIILPKSDELWRASRRNADSAMAGLHSEALSGSKQLFASRLLQLGLLVSTLLVAAVLLAWVAVDVRRRYRSARTALEAEREMLQSTEDQLDRVSILDRGQALVLEQIATDKPLSEVFRTIATLTLMVTGRNAVRMTTDSVSVTVPPDGDGTGQPLWSKTFRAAGSDKSGTLEVLGDPTMPDPMDDLARTSLLRCLDLAALELEHEESRRAADALAEAKSNYVATVSHEFRAPLHAILGFSELLENQLSPRGSSEALEWAGRVRTEAERLTRLIEDLQNLTRLDAERTQTVSEPFNIRTLLDNLIHTCRVTAKAKGLRLEGRIDPALSEWRSGDPDRLHQVLLNLVSNATKFTREGRIDVEISSAATLGDPDLVRFAVTDTGPGIPAEDIQRILEPFAQVSSSDAARGSGLGLAISNGIVKALGGDGLEVVSLEGHGSTFHFSLPLPTAAAPAQVSRFVAGNVPAGPAASILVVDDSQANQFLAEAQLKKLGHRYAAAFDGEQALARLRSERFDLVLMDCNMPVMDGYEATRRIRAAERGTGRHMRILALTAASADGNRSACERAGMDGFLTKPLLLGDLARELHRFLGVGHLEDPAADVDGGPGITGKASAAMILDDARIDRLLDEIGAAPLRRVADAFVVETPRRREELRRAMENSDAEAVRRSVHAIRSPSAMLGAVALVEELKAIEDSADPISGVRESNLDDLIDATLQRLGEKMSQIPD